MGPDQHRQERELLGAYALGQLDAADRARVQEHLAGCAECRAELASLDTVAAALRGLDPDTLAPVDATPPAGLADDLFTTVGTRRRAAARRSRVRRVLAGGLVAAGLVGAFALGGRTLGTPDAPPVVAVSLRVLPSAVQAQAGLVRHTWGTELDLEASGLADGGTYTVVFLTRDGTRVPAGSFLGTGSRPLHCSVNAAVSLDATAEVQVTDDRGALVMDASVG